MDILPTFFVVLLLSQTVISPPSSWSSPRARRTHCHSQTLKTTTCESYLSRAFLELSRTAAANILSQGQPPTVSNVLNKNNQMSKPTLRSRNNRGQSNRAGCFASYWQSDTNGSAYTFIFLMMHFFFLPSPRYFTNSARQHYCHDLCRQPRLFRTPHFDNSVRTTTVHASWIAGLILPFWLGGEFREGCTIKIWTLY